MAKKKTNTAADKKERRARRYRTAKRVMLGMLLLVISFMIFGVAYVLNLEALKNFDASVILDAPQSLIVYDAKGEQVSLLSGTQTRIWVKFDQIPPHVIHAFLSAEDARFYEHIGVDLIRIMGAALEDIKAGSYVQGASTISQQLVKLSHLTDEKVMTRKIEEAVLAYQMERQFTKNEILEMYLNYVYFGGGFYGLEAAARGFFGVGVQDLTIAQSAMLAGILKSPSRYAPHLNMEASVSRRNLVIRLMCDYEYISEAEKAQAQAEPVTLTNSLMKDNRGYYIDLALQQSCEALNISMDELLTGGYRIHTAMDTELQATLEEALQDDTLFPEAGEEVQAALVVVDTRTGGVAALMGGRESTTALAYNRATRIRRQPGSVIKPIIAYAPALEQSGYTTVSMLLDEPTDFNGYQPANFGARYRGWVTLREAVMHSLNVPAVKVLSDIGLGAGMDFARSVGIEFDDQDESLALALGGFTYGVSPYQIAGAYAAFSRGGLYCTPALVLFIDDRHGERVFTYQPENRRVMSEANAYILTDMLQSAIEDGTGKRLGELDIPLAGKTGTTGGSDGNRDVWMAAYNPEYAAAVWMGYDEGGGGRVLPNEMTGGTYPALILSRIFSKLYEEKAAPAFAMPEDVVEVKLDGYTLTSAHTAVLASVLTPAKSIQREVFARGTEPTRTSAYWTVPGPPTAFAARIGAQGQPLISFEPQDSHILYRLYREDAYGNAQLLAEYPGERGAVSHADTTALQGQTYSYYVIPAHPQMEFNGMQVVGPSTRKLTLYVPINPFMSHNGAGRQPSAGEAGSDNTYPSGQPREWLYSYQ